MRTAGDVRQQHDIVEREQGLRHLRFVVEYIQRGTSNFLIHQRIHQCHFIDHRSARDVDEKAVRAERVEHVCRYKMPRFRAARACNDEKICPAREVRRAFSSTSRGAR